MDDTTNPLIPGYYDAIWVVAPVLALALLIVALVSISRTAHRSRTEVVVWVLVVLLAPVLGSIAWLAVKASLRRPAPQPPAA
jgi:protein-S-isoprenylcysteine O-methyltransferase Ste14